ncbi:hypothetical protein F4805DRAFT_169310 [Annulohypoxylon moriforme]|nr:hypothetical protein F4805DRAFT_169310 [Annulohypoxylon moriforme]
MRFSKALQSSPHSYPSPDGELIATLLPSNIVIRTIQSLEVLRTVKLPPDLSTGVTNFLWSPSSTRLLVAIIDQIHVFSARSGDFHGVVRIPPSAGRSSFVDFGAADNEVCIWSPFGIKLTLVNLTNSKVVEIANPKFYSAVSATKGCSFRPKTKHLVLLTRSSGKDMISIHSPETRELQRSWYPDTIDAQGLVWTPDGRWLVVCESSAQSPRVLFYTSDGHIFKDWSGPLSPAPQDMGLLGTGVKAFTLSPDNRLAAIANSSTCICILNTPSMVETMRLHHPQVIQPKDTLQIWQEQNNFRNNGSIPLPRFIKATQTVTPQWTALNSLQEPTSGCNFVKFDCSSSLLATRLEDAPGTIWIWDLPSSDLRAVLMYHANVTKLEWHPVHPELLLIRCEGDGYGSLVFAWDPLSQGPRSIDMSRQFPEALSSKTYAAWVQTRADSAALFFTDNATCMLVSLADSDGEALPWHDDSAPDSPMSHGNNINMRSSPKRAYEPEDAEDSIDFDLDDEYGSEPDDTFQFISR